MHTLASCPSAAPAFRARVRRANKRAAATSAVQNAPKQAGAEPAVMIDGTSRRAALVGLGALAASAYVDKANAVQGLVPGRIPGLGKPQEDGFRQYTRPEGKSGGHGVGWSEIAQYSFIVPPTWDEIPVSIADPGGSELDLRFQSVEEGDAAVLVAPVLRFRDVGFNADVSLEDLFEPKRLIYGFGPELIGKPIEDDDLVSVNTVSKKGRTYYEYELKSKHLLVSATAFKNRLFIFYAYSSPRQWRKSQEGIRRMVASFYVDPK